MTLRVAVVGAGPAGLAAALLLARDGHSVQLFERFAKAGPVGSGLMLQPTGLTVLHALTLLPEILRLGSRIERLDGCDASTGRRVLDVRYDSIRGGRFGLGIHRAALFQVLHDAATREGIPIVTGFDARSLDRDGVLSSGPDRAGPFDLVVDASGARSAIRAAAVGAPRIRALHYGALWATLPFVEEGFDPRALQQRYRRASVMAGILPVGRTQPGGPPLAAFFWSCRGDALAGLRERGLDRWKAEVRAVWPALEPYLDGLSRFDQLTFAAYAHHTLARPAKRNYVAIGDAAHQTSPQLGQGVNMALLDAYALAKGLREETALPAALARYRAARRTHVRLYQAASLVLTPFYQSDGRLVPLLRDTLVPTIAKIPPAPAILANLVAGRVGDPLGHLQLDEPDWPTLAEEDPLAAGFPVS